MSTTNCHPALELNGFGVAFGRRVVLDNIALSLPPEGIDVLMGPVKAGKSSLLRTLAGLFEGHSLHKTWGSTFVNGKPLEMQNHPPLVQQHALIPDLPLMQVLLHPMRARQLHRSAEWNQLGTQWMQLHGLGEYTAQAHQSLMQFPPSIQRSVLILAQAITKPSVLLIDEPTYGLGEADASWMVDWLKKLSIECKLWVSLHNQLQAKRLSDRIVLIGGGRLLSHQECAAFFAQPANEWVEQFIRTGSLSLPSPDALPQDLEPNAHLPPPLSSLAQEAIQLSPVSTPALEPSPTQTAPDHSIKPLEAVKLIEAVHVVAPSLKVERRAEVRKFADLPPVSAVGVEMASMVGNAILHSGSAPRGFNWIVPGKLAGCPAPGVSAPIDFDLELLAKVGITRLITLTETDLDQDALHRNEITNTHLPIFDREAPSIGQTHMLLVRMQRYMEAGDVLAVHCKAGLGRTGTILAAWLIREGGLSAVNAVERLRRIEPGFIQSEIQEEFLTRYEADLTSRLT
jgi:atypical dual specificity phosphatase